MKKKKDHRAAARSEISRRTFLAGAGASTLGGCAMFGGGGSRNLLPETEPLRVACIGVGGKGWTDMNETADCAGVEIVAVCDVDAGRLKKAAGRYPDATPYTDWRLILDRADIHAVTVTTPDHMHAPISLPAIRRGWHVYCQKPLTHNIAEARRMAEEASEYGVVTQMGIQHHSRKYFRRSVETIRSGAIGRVREVHVWTDRPKGWWPQGIERPSSTDPVPDDLAWDLWLGVADTRPYSKNIYHPFKWRGWVDFGTGSLGDMGCHLIDPILTALEPGPPRRVRSDGDPPNGETFPASSVIRYEFGPGERIAGSKLEMTWYDGGIKPEAAPLLWTAGSKLPDNGAILVGEKGNLYANYADEPILLPEADFKDFDYPDAIDGNHYDLWVRACHGGERTGTAFDTYAGPLTETVLLGNLALHHPGGWLDWDSVGLKVPNLPEADRLIRREYRSGWESYA